MLSPPIPRYPQTSKQAKRAFAKRGGSLVSDAERRRIARNVELEQRAERIREKEQKKKENKRKRMEKEEKDRGMRRRMGREATPPKVEEGQMRLSGLWRKQSPAKKEEEDGKENSKIGVEIKREGSAERSRGRELPAEPSRTAHATGNDVPQMKEESVITRSNDEKSVENRLESLVKTEEKLDEARTGLVASAEVESGAATCSDRANSAAGENQPRPLKHRRFFEVSEDEDGKGSKSPPSPVYRDPKCDQKGHPSSSRSEGIGSLHGLESQVTYTESNARSTKRRRTTSSTEFYCDGEPPQDQALFAQVKESGSSRDRKEQRAARIQERNRASQPGRMSSQKGSPRVMSPAPQKREPLIDVSPNIKMLPPPPLLPPPLRNSEAKEKPTETTILADDWTSFLESNTQIERELLASSSPTMPRTASPQKSPHKSLAMAATLLINSDDLEAFLKSMSSQESDTLSLPRAQELPDSRNSSWDKNDGPSQEQVSSMEKRTASLKPSCTVQFSSPEKRTRRALSKTPSEFDDFGLADEDLIGLDI